MCLPQTMPSAAAVTSEIHSLPLLTVLASIYLHTTRTQKQLAAELDVRVPQTRLLKELPHALLVVLAARVFFAHLVSQLMLVNLQPGLRVGT